jgi:hypothetical protein
VGAKKGINNNNIVHLFTMGVQQLVS